MRLQPRAVGTARSLESCMTRSHSLIDVTDKAAVAWCCSMPGWAAALTIQLTDEPVVSRCWVWMLGSSWGCWGVGESG
jgi:hypothetical protein